MFIGLGDTCLSTDANGNCTSTLVSSPTPYAGDCVYGSDASGCLSPSTALPGYGVTTTGAPATTLQTASAALSGNSALIVAACAILGLVFAMGKR